MKHNNGDIFLVDYQIVNNSLVATSPTESGGTISENSLIVFFIGGDNTERVAQYLHGTQQ